MHISKENKLIYKIGFILFCVFFISLPFVHSLTINVGFPLKISEVSLFLALICLPAFVNFTTLSLLRPYILTLSIFLLIVSFSTVINIVWDYPYPLNTSNFRFNPALGSIFKTLYVYFAVIAGIATFICLKKNESFIINLILAGGILAAAYAWYLFWFSLLGIHYHTLPGTEQYPQAALFKFGHFIRCGTFKEGNHMGLYLLTTGILAFYNKKYIIGGVLFITTITTASSIAIFTSLLFIAMVIIHKGYLAGKLIPIMSIFLALLISATLILYSYSPDFRYLTAKIIPNKSNETADAVYSQNERLNLAKASIRMAVENPFTGIGLTKFSAHYPHFNKDVSFNEKNEKMLPNNIYLEILSEAGFIALILFTAFLIQLLLNINSFILKSGLVVIMIYWMAYPTFTILFLWVYIGVCWFNGSKNSKNLQVN